MSSPRPFNHFDPKVLALMEQIGGSFASNLARAWQRADASNAFKLMVAFGDLYDTYATMLASSRSSDV